jgi:uncharacterized membrane protein
MVLAIQNKKEIVMNKTLQIIIWPILLAPVLYLAAVWNSLPQKTAIHFNIRGNPDRFSDKSEMWIYTGIITVIAIAIYVLLPLSYKIDRKKKAAENKSRLQKLAFAIAVFLSLVTCIIINSVQKGDGIRLNIKLIFGSIGVMWCIMGNYMHNIKPNHFAGFRTRWTLNNEENWRKTHLLGGKVWFAGGLAIAIASLLASRNVLIGVFGIVSVIITLVPFIYSYRLYKKQQLAQN